MPSIRFAATPNFLLSGMTCGQAKVSPTIAKAMAGKKSFIKPLILPEREYVFLDWLRFDNLIRR
jgi:hypothetical protein